MNFKNNEKKEFNYEEYDFKFIDNIRQLNYYILPEKNMFRLLELAVEYEALDEKIAEKIKELYGIQSPKIKEMKFINDPLEELMDILDEIKMGESIIKNQLHFKVYLSWVLHDLDVIDLSMNDLLETDRKAWYQYVKLKISSGGKWNLLKKISIEE